jgi:hypothetical protein
MSRTYLDTGPPEKVERLATRPGVQKDRYRPAPGTESPQKARIRQVWPALRLVRIELALPAASWSWLHWVASGRRPTT